MTAQTSVLTKAELGQCQNHSGLATALSFLLIWGLIISLMALGEHYFSQWWMWPPIIIIMACLQHSLAAMAHEATHGLLFKSEWANKWAGRFLASFPIFVSYNRYKAIHLLHHRKLYTDQDPDTPIYLRYPLTKRKLAKTLLRDFFGMTVLKNTMYFCPLPKFFYPHGQDPLKYYPHKSEGILMLIFWLFVFAAVFFFGKIHLLIFFWFLPYISLMQVLLRVRAALEHGAVPDPQDRFQNTRTVTDHPLVLLLMAPFALNYHLEHHLYPTIPWYRLHFVHSALLRSGKSFLHANHYKSALKSLYR